MSMCVTMSFNREAVENGGYSIDKIRSVIKSIFAKDGLPCVSDGEVLAFTGKGSEDDWSDLLNGIWELMLTPWFTDVASSVLFIEDGEVEDVLAQKEIFNEFK